MHKATTSTTMPAMRTLFITLALVGFGCGDDGGSATPDAPPPPPPDAPAVAPTCADYCTKITANCMMTNAQYPTEAQCLATCATFTVGTGADTTGNTLGCRVYHAENSAGTGATLHCPHAGPGGDAINAPNTYCTKNATNNGDVCDSFCNIEIAVCGSLDAPKTGITAPYQNLAACKTACAGFTKTPNYSVGATGNNLACRLYHVTNAALFSSQGNTATTNTHCGHTGQVATANCI